MVVIHCIVLIEKQVTKYFFLVLLVFTHIYILCCTDFLVYHHFPHVAMYFEIGTGNLSCAFLLNLIFPLQS